MTTLLELPAALAILRARAGRLPVETVLAGDAAGRVCATAVTNPVDIPPHTGAALDGFAVRSRDLARAGAATAMLLPVAGHTRCGEAPACGMPGTAWEVFSGAALPAPFDAVIRADDAAVVTLQEDGTPTWVRVTAPVEAGRDVRARGEDLPAGALLAASGTRLAPAHLMALATAGVERVDVRVQPRVAVLSTGRELVDDSRDALTHGQVRNSNAPYLVAMLQRHGALPRYLRTVADDADEFQRSLAWASTHRFPLVISSGATAAAREDFVGATLRAIGAEVLFRGVAIRPGWPVMAARLPHGGLFLGLPGNPASCAACFRLFVLPALRVLSDQPDECPVKALLADDTPRDPERTRVLKARTEAVDGRLVTRALAGQDAHRIAPLLEANAWILLPPGDAPAQAGTLVETLPAHDCNAT